MYPDRAVFLFSLALSGTVVVGALTMGPLNFAVQAAEVAQMVEGRKAEADALRASEADRLLKEGDELREKNQFQDALKPLQQALAIYQANGNRAGEGQVLKSLGNSYLDLKQPEKALALFQQSLAIAREIKNQDLEARSLNCLGHAYDRLKNVNQAINYYEQSLAIARKSNNRKVEEISLSNLGSAYYSPNNYAKAIDYYKQSLAIARELKNQSGEANSLNDLGYAYYLLGDYAKAIEYHKQTLEIVRKLKKRQWEEELLRNLGNVYFALGDYVKSIEIHEQGLAIAQKNKNQWGEVESLQGLGDAYFTLGNYAKALDYYGKSLAIARELSGQILEGHSPKGLRNIYKSLESRALSGLGGTYKFLGDYVKAIEYYDKSLAIAREIKDRKDERRLLGKMGDAYKSVRDYDKAIELHQQALEVAREINDREQEVSALLDLGHTYEAISTSRQDYQKAIDLFQQALALAREIKNASQEVYALDNIASVYNSLNEYSKAFEFASASLASAKSQKDPDKEFTALLSLSNLYFRLGDYQKANELFRQGISSAHTNIHNIKDQLSDLPILYNGFLTYNQGNSRETIKFAKQIQSPRLKDYALYLLSASYADLSDYKKAIDLFNQMDNGSKDLMALGYIYSKGGRQEQAIEIYRKILAEDAESGIAGNSAHAQAGLARIYRGMKMPLTAITYYKQSINEIEKVRRNIRELPKELQNSFISNIQNLGYARPVDVYRELADLLLSQGRILEAQQILELLKSQEVKDFTRAGKFETTPPNVPLTPKEGEIRDKTNSLIAFGLKVNECQQKTCPQLDQLLNQRDTLTQQFDQQVQSIEKAYRDREVKDRTTLAPQDFLPQAQQIVEAQPGTVLIYPLVLENKTWLLWASKGVVVKSVELPNIGQRQLGETVLKFRQLLQNPYADPKEVKAVGKQLYDWLLKPIESELKANQIQNLVFSLDRATRYIPMAALFDGEKYLIERYTISTVLSAGYTDMSSQLPPSVQNTKVLALGLSDAKAGFNALPNVPAELHAIVRQGSNNTQGIYPGRELLNTAFDFPALRRYVGDYQIIHIATHGKFEPTNPDKSFLMLGDGNQLAIPQIRTLQNLRNVYLVVLSACETGLGGADQDGIEIAGISSYFLQKGKAKAVMASLWNVNDASTALMMQQFYKHLASGKTKAAALQQVQQDLILGKLTVKDANALDRAGARRHIEGQLPVDSLAHPYYWAPFILIGNSL